METLRQTIEIPKNHRIDIQLPKHIPIGRAEIAITVNPIGVCENSLENKLLQMREAVNDPAFMSDLQETMSDFESVDYENWS